MQFDKFKALRGTPTAVCKFDSDLVCNNRQCVEEIHEVEQFVY